MINVTESFLPPLEEYSKLLERLWTSKHMTNRGEYVLKLEDMIHNYLGSQQKPLLVTSGTVALQLAIRALDLEGEIITTPFSYVATTSTIVWERCTPVFVDIHPEYLTVDVNQIEAAITEKTSAILVTHVFGNLCDVEKIKVIAEKHNLKVIYDAAHCFGVKYKDQSVFDFGDISICSYHATKLFHMCEGGAVYCNDTSLSEKVYKIHNFGHAGEESIDGLGINAKVDEFNAAFGVSMMPYVDEILARRQGIVGAYDEQLNWSQLRRLKIVEGCEWNYSYYPIIFEDEAKLLELQVLLQKQDVYPRRYFYPSLNRVNYVEPVDMPHSDSISKRILCLPLYYHLDREKQALIVRVLNGGLS